METASGRPHIPNAIPRFLDAQEGSVDETVHEETWDPYEGSDGTVGGPAEQAEEAARRVILAGLGAAALAVDTAEDTFNRFVDRGQQVQEELEERAREARHGRMMRRGRLGYAFRNAMDAFLDTLSVPNKADVDTINVKLNILTRKIDDLQMERMSEREGPAPGIPTPASAPPTPDQEMGT